MVLPTSLIVSTTLRTAGVKYPNALDKRLGATFRLSANSRLGAYSRGRIIKWQRKTSDNVIGGWMAFQKESFKILLKRHIYLFRVRDRDISTCQVILGEQMDLGDNVNLTFYVVVWSQRAPSCHCFHFASTLQVILIHITIYKHQSAIGKSTRWSSINGFSFSNTLTGEVLSCESDVFFEKWRKFRQTEILPDKVSPNKIVNISLNDLLPSSDHLYFNKRHLLLLGKSDEFFVWWRKFRPTKFRLIRYSCL